MEITYKQGVKDAKDLYMLTTSPNIHKMTEKAGQTLAVKCAVRYSDVIAGETREAVAIMDKDGTVYASASPTFIRDFDRMISIFAEYDEIVHTIEVMSGTSRNGRNFLTCRYVD